jgi:hypothetical protein
MTERINALVNAREPIVREPARDSRPADPALEQLRPTDDSPLALRNLNHPN